MEILFYSQRSTPAKIVQSKANLGAPKVGFDAPAAVVEPGKLLNRVGLCSGLMKPDTHLGDNARH